MSTAALRTNADNDPAGMALRRHLPRLQKLPPLQQALAANPPFQ
jgi:hypothetical protein